MSRPFARTLIVVVALAHALLYIAYQSPDWLTEWTDQAGYTRLGRALAQTGRFTRYPDYPTFVPEVLRTPGYPAFVAAVNLTLGQGNLPVALAQAGVFALICLIVVALAERVASTRTAFAAGLVTALYPPLPYYGALTLTEVFTTFVVTLAVLLWLRAVVDRNRGAIAIPAAGLVLALAALTRPTFQFLGVALAAAACLVAPRGRTTVRRNAAVVGVVALGVAPWLLYNVVYLHMFTFTPAGGIGRTLWEGAWQVALPGRVESTLTSTAERVWDRGELDRSVREYAASVRMDPDPMLRYVHQWQAIRKMWDEPQDPWQRAVARIAADREYGRVALTEIRRDPVRHVWRRLTRGMLLLWITEIPIRYSDINRLPTLVIRLIWAVQAVLMAAAAAGVYALWRTGARAEAAVFAVLILYVSAVHAVLYSEARYALPAKPIVLLLATVAVADFLRRRTRATP